MRIHLSTKLYLQFAAFLLISACSPGSPPSMEGFVDFQSFISDITKASASDYLGKPGVRVENAKEFDAMKAHILSMYEGVTVENSFIENDQFVDCIPIDQQPGLKRLKLPLQKADRNPPKPDISPSNQRAPAGVELAGETRDNIDITLKKGATDRFGKEMFCKEGTIPMRRLTLREMTRFKTLNQFFAKGSLKDDFSLGSKRAPHALNLPEDETHYYARGVQYVNSFGGDSWLNLWSPSVASDQMSLSQQWFVGGEGDKKQTVEAGWQVYPNRWDGNNAALFIYYTTAGYNDNSGCYNKECDGFVQIANNVYLGRGFTQYSSENGTQWGFNLQWKRNTDGNWWLFYRGPGDYIAVGYYPKSLWKDGQLASKATKIAYGGEDTGQQSAKQMGSGKKADQGWQKAAFQNMVFYIDTSSVSQWASLNKDESNPDCYTADIHNIYGDWGTFLYFGGPSCN